MISDGVIGKIFRLESRFERFRKEINPGSWRENQEASEGGGILLDLQPHLLSTALDWFGPAELVSSSLNSIRGGVDDDSVLVLKHASGVDSYLSASAIVGSPGPRVRLIGDKGALIISDLDPQEAILRSGVYPKGEFGSKVQKAKLLFIVVMKSQSMKVLMEIMRSFIHRLKKHYLAANGPSL